MTKLILLIALILRIPLLNQSLWLDEAIQALALMGRKGPLLQYALADFQPPLYHFLLSAWTNLFGYSEIALRTPSLLFGIASIYFTIKLVRKISDTKTAHIAGLLLATNPLHIYYSQEGRTYMLTTLFVVASFYYLLDLLKTKKPKTSTIIYYLISTTFSLWTSYLAWIAIALQAVYLVIKKNKKILTWNLLPISTLFLWLPSVTKQLGIGFSNIELSSQWGQVVGAFDPLRIPRTWIKFIFGRISIANKIAYAGLALSALTYHTLHILKVKNKHRNLLLLWLLGTITMALVISFFVPVYQYFRLLFILPAYLALLALGVVKSKKVVLHTLILISIQLASLAYFWIKPEFHRENWKELTNHINRNTEHAVVALPSLDQNAPLEYYNVKYQIIEPAQGFSKDYTKIYYINYAEDLFDAEQKGREIVDSKGYKIEEEKIFTGLHLIIYYKIASTSGFELGMKQK